MAWSPAMKRYNWRVLWLSLIYAVLLITVVYGFKHHYIGGLFAYAAAVAPALPIIGIFAAIGRYLVEEQDEYVRMLMVRQTLWASGFALSVATVWGFLENFDLVEHVDAYSVAIAWFAGLGIGSIINRLTLGAPAHC